MLPKAWAMILAAFPSAAAAPPSCPTAAVGPMHHKAALSCRSAHQVEVVLCVAAHRAHATTSVRDMCERSKEEASELSPAPRLACACGGHVVGQCSVEIKHRGHRPSVAISSAEAGASAQTHSFTASACSWRYAQAVVLCVHISSRQQWLRRVRAAALPRDGWGPKLKANTVC